MASSIGEGQLWFQYHFKSLLDDVFIDFLYIWVSLPSWSQHLSQRGHNVSKSVI